MAWAGKAARSDVTAPKRCRLSVRAEHAASGAILDRALVAPDLLAPAEVLRLQRSIGNEATARLLVGTSRPPHRRVPENLPAVQRHLQNTHGVSYGGTNANGVGTTMEAELWQDPGVGGAPSVEPAWWPHGADIAAPFFRNYMVQGHLLNHQIGGPGNTMANLTPITRSANTMHEKKIESAVKQHVAEGDRVVDYHVYADYSKAPKASELAPNESGAVQNWIDHNYAPKLPYQIVAEYTAWKEGKNNVWKAWGDRWKIGNEGKEIT